LRRRPEGPMRQLGPGVARAPVMSTMASVVTTTMPLACGGLGRARGIVVGIFLAFVIRSLVGRKITLAWDQRTRRNGSRHDALLRRNFRPSLGNRLRRQCFFFRLAVVPELRRDDLLLATSDQKRSRVPRSHQPEARAKLDRLTNEIFFLEV